MADIRYYVSQQKGDDSNDGLTKDTAWKTLTKAMQSVPTPSTGDNIYVHIGPGTYRERVIPTNNGRSTTEKIHYCGDPYCTHLTSDTPGRVRITGCDNGEYPTNGRILDWTNKTNIELWDVYVDGSANEYACHNIPVARRVHAASLNGFYGGTQYNCTAIGGNQGFSTGTQYNCTAIGGNQGFYRSTQYNCTAIGGNQGFSTGTQYNCTAIGGNQGFYTGTQYNCTAICGNQGFYIGAQYNCTAIGGNQGFYTGEQYNCKTVYVQNNKKIPAKHILPDLLSIMPNYSYLFGMNKYGYPHNVNNNYSSTMNLQEERLYAFTPTETGKSIGAQLRINSLAVSGNITVELQKYITDTWVTQRSKTISIADLTASDDGFNYFEWDTGTGDNALTTAASTWRFRITADNDAKSTVLYGSNATTLTIIGHFLPDSVPSDIEGKGLHGSVLQGALDVASLSLDSTIYQASAPSIKFEGHGEKIQKLPVKKNTAVTVTYQVRHDGAASGKEPQISLKHKDITTQTATHSAGANTWQKLSVSVTPAFDGVIDVVLVSRDNTKNAWFSNPTVS